MAARIAGLGTSTMRGVEGSLLAGRYRVLRRLGGATPTFEMHVVPRVEVEQTIRRHGGRVIRAVDDNAAGPGWLSYTYICQRC